MQFLKKSLSLILLGLALMGLSPDLSTSAPVQALPLDNSVATTEQIQTITWRQLPPEARQTLQAIQAGRPYPYRQDGTIFGNREKRLPLKPRGYYREYTVPTPGISSRGARRIVSGEKGEFYYTQDHYNRFFRVRMN
jgi:ribonuclease T1